MQQTEEKLRERNMFSKFLYYSIMANQREQQQVDSGSSGDQVDNSGLVKSPTRLSEPQLPDVSLQEKPEEELYFSDDSEVL